MILITGAAGKTGRAIFKSLLDKKADVRVLVRRREQAEELSKAGAADAVIGDMTDPAVYSRSMAGVDAVYHICPNMHPEETEIGRKAIIAALENKIEHFVYHSVLHPHTGKMPHHWQKLKVEEMLFESGLNFTILQPAPYMQNILAFKNDIMDRGEYPLPYPAQTRLSMLDLADLGEVAAKVFTEPGHVGSNYEIVGTKGISQLEVAAQISEGVGKIICVREVSLGDWRDEVEKAGMESYAVETLQKMFIYYGQFGLWGNPGVLTHLLERQPGTIADFARRELSM